MQHSRSMNQNKILGKKKCISCNKWRSRATGRSEEKKAKEDNGSTTVPRTSKVTMKSEDDVIIQIISFMLSFQLLML